VLRAGGVLALTVLMAGTAEAQTFPGIPAEVMWRKRALFARNLDQPLVAPPNAAINVQLTFRPCHVRFAVIACLDDPGLEMWTYNVDTHQIRHSQSGQCINISGGRRDSGAWIILYPCSNAPNEKWTVVRATGYWTIRSDHSGLCLEAQPGPPGPGGIAAVATLVQRPCNGSTAQQFAETDSEWSLRHQPH
jgi:hypothetical protein